MNTAIDNIQKNIEEFDEKFEWTDFSGDIGTHVLLKKLSSYATEETERNELRVFISTSIAQAVAEEREMLRGEIEKIKTLVQKATGSFKYDSCYDDVISLLPTNTKREK